MPNYALYQDGEINFTIQAPDNTTIAIFSAKKSETSSRYSISKSDFTKPCFPKTETIFSGPYSREETIELAYRLAHKFATDIDLNFKDKTSMRNIGKLEQYTNNP